MYEASCWPVGNLEKPTSTDMDNYIFRRTSLLLHEKLFVCSFNQSVQTVLIYHVYINFITNLEEEILNDLNKCFSLKFSQTIYFSVSA